MKNSSDLERFLKSKNISSSYIDYNKNKLNFGMPKQMQMDGYDVFSSLFENRILILSGEIDDYLCELLKAQMLYLEMQNSNDITLYINSGGGSVYSGLGLLDIMDYVRPDISTINTGLAASMAAIILCSGTKGKRKALKRSRTMIHQPLGYGGWVQQASDMEIEAREINELKKELYEIISDRNRDYWMTAKSALDYGMIDSIVTKRKKKK